MASLCNMGLACWVALVAMSMGWNCALCAKTTTITVGAYGRFKTVQSAINSVPVNNMQPVTILISKGVYREKVKVDRAFITLVGQGAMVTVIEFGDNAATAKGTFPSATFSVLANNFVAKDLTVANTAPAARAGEANKQAVAMLVKGDKVAMYGVKMLSYQDTLLAYSGRHFYSGCYIAGTTDFIAGDATAMFKGCTIASRAKDFGIITAQKRDSPSGKTGFIFVGCKITKEGNANAKIKLGRPWGQAAFVLFYNTQMDNIINPDPWDFDVVGSSGQRAKTYFYEVNSKGPGAARDPRAPPANPRPLSPRELRQYTSTLFVDSTNWLNSH